VKNYFDAMDAGEDVEARLGTSQGIDMLFAALASPGCRARGVLTR
jgi:hypothetical protein